MNAPLSMEDLENKVLHGLNLDILKRIPDNTFHAIVMDPPYGLGKKEPSPEDIQRFLLEGMKLDTGGDFMGTDWEIPTIPIWRELFRVLRPGGYVLTFGGSRTWDLISLGARMVGFEFRDSLPDVFPDMPGVFWTQGMGMPHGPNISKEIDKDLGAERKVVGTYKVGGNALTSTKLKGGTYTTGAPNSPSGYLERTVSTTEEGAQWEGWHTNLKPAWEPVMMFRKPLEGRVIDNIRKWGVGALNIDGTRIYTDWNEKDRPEGWKRSGKSRKPEAKKIAAPPGIGISMHPDGRHPSNVVFVHSPECTSVTDGRKTTWVCAPGCSVFELDAQKGPHAKEANSRYYATFECPKLLPFMYTPKAPRKETTMGGRLENDHPTKKPLKLMQWLVRMVTPKEVFVCPSCYGTGQRAEMSRMQSQVHSKTERTGDVLDQVSEQGCGKRRTKRSAKKMPRVSGVVHPEGAEREVLFNFMSGECSEEAGPRVSGLLTALPSQGQCKEEAEMVLEEVRRQGASQASRASDVSRVSEGVHPEASRAYTQILLKNMQCQGDGEGSSRPEESDSQGVCDTLHAGALDVHEAWDAVGTSLGHGSTSESRSATQRSCSPSQRKQVRQQDRELGVNDQEEPRSTPQDTSETFGLPSLSRENSGGRECPSCGATMNQVGGLILDPYCGSGTMLHAAILEGVRFTGIERKESYCEISRKRVELVWQDLQPEQIQDELFDLISNLEQEG